MLPTQLAHAEPHGFYGPIKISADQILAVGGGLDFGINITNVGSLCHGQR